MLYDVLILVFLILIFCFFSMMLTVNVMFRMFNAVRPEGTKEIKPLELKKQPKKTKEQLEIEKKAAEEKRKYETIMSNLDAYDGTEVGQKEVK